MLHTRNCWDLGPIGWVRIFASVRYPAGTPVVEPMRHAFTVRDHWLCRSRIPVPRPNSLRRRFGAHVGRTRCDRSGHRRSAPGLHALPATTQAGVLCGFRHPAQRLVRRQGSVLPGGERPRMSAAQAPGFGARLHALWRGRAPVVDARLRALWRGRVPGVHARLRALWRERAPGFHARLRASAAGRGLRLARFDGGGALRTAWSRVPPLDSTAIGPAVVAVGAFCSPAPIGCGGDSDASASPH